MTDKATLSAMTPLHAEAVRRAAFDAPDYAAGRAREVLANISSQANGKTVTVPREEIERLKQDAAILSARGVRGYAHLVGVFNRWLSRSTPEEAK